VAVQLTSVVTTSSNVRTQVAVSTDLSSVTVTMTAEICPMNRTAVSDFCNYFIASGNFDAQNAEQCPSWRRIHYIRICSMFLHSHTSRYLVIEY